MKMRRPLNRDEIAAEIAYPDGSMTVSGLRRERDAGRLVVERTAGKEYTTLKAIADMRELCRVPARPQAGRACPPLDPGSISARDALLAKLRARDGSTGKSVGRRG